MELKEKLKNLKTTLQMNDNLMSVYDYHGFTIQEILNVFFTKINECIENVNNTLELVEWLVNEGLETKVAEKLAIMVEDGTFETLINDVVLKEINDKVDTGLVDMKTLVDNGIKTMDTKFTNAMTDINTKVTDYYNKTTKDFNMYQYEKNSVKYIAHRGMSSLAPENSLAAFKLAGEYGYYGAECDIMETADNNFILMHDETVDRMTNGSGTVMGMTLAQVKNLKIDNGKGIAKYSNEKVPTLEEYLNVCKIYDMIPVMEIKTIKQESVPKLLDIVRKWGFENKAVFISFTMTYLEKLRELSKDITLQPLVDFTEYNINYCMNLGKNTHIDVQASQVTKELVELAHQKGVLVNCWTVNADSERVRLEGMGVDFITTDTLLSKQMRIGDKEKVPQINNIDVYSSISNLYNMVKKKPYLRTFKVDNIFLAQHINEPGHSYEDVILSGQPTGTRAKCITKFYIDDELCKIRNLPTGYKVTLVPFDDKDKSLGDIGWLRVGELLKMPPNTKYVCPYFTKEDGKDFSETDIANIKKAVIDVGSDTITIKPGRLTYGQHGATAGLHFNKCFSATTSQAPRVFGREVHYTRGYVDVKVRCDSNLRITLMPFTTYDLFIEDLGWKVNGDKFKLPSNTSYVVVYASNVDDTGVTDDQFRAISNSLITIY